MTLIKNIYPETGAHQSVQKQYECDMTKQRIVKTYLPKSSFMFLHIHNYFQCSASFPNAVVLSKLPIISLKPASNRMTR